MNGKKKGYSKVEHFEISDDNIENHHDENFEDNTQIEPLHSDWHMLFTFIFMVIISLSSLISLVCALIMIRLTFERTMRWYVCAVITLPQLLEKMIVYFMLRRIHTIEEDAHASSSFSLPIFYMQQEGSQRRKRCSFWKILRFAIEMMVLIVIGVIYFHIIPKLCKAFIAQFFLDFDGIPVYDWNNDALEMKFIINISKICGSFYLLGVSVGLVALALAKLHQGADSTNRSTIYTPYFFRGEMIYKCMQSLSLFEVILTALLFLLSVKSAWTFLIDHNISDDATTAPYCDPMDTTECLLPFPSSYFSVEDNKTNTGIRVNISEKAMLSIYRRGNDANNLLDFNDRDGFGTNGIILFYMDGIKEGVVANLQHGATLMGPNQIANSTESNSMTLLLDVEAKTLIHHFAEIDYIDNERPLIAMQAAKSLEFNKRYAVVLQSARDGSGTFIPRTKHLSKLLNPSTSDLSEAEKRRGKYYRDIILPTLTEIAPWLDIDTIQMLFEFHTTSVEASPNAVTRDLMKQSLKTVANREWKENENVRLLKLDDYTAQCVNNSGQLIGKRIHIEIDVPDFEGGNGREKYLEVEALANGHISKTSPYEVLVTIPCSITTNSKALSATVDYGHGLLGNMFELLDTAWLHNAANKYGYITFASNWRGMSQFDFLLVVKAFLSNPNEVSTVVENLMQGYGNRISVQHFVNTALLDCSFMKMIDGTKVRVENPVRRIFYGISMGAIFGSVYSSLVSHIDEKILDASVITSGGSPFCFLLGRSALHEGYLFMLSRNINTRRQIRIFFSLMQMKFDGVDGPANGIFRPRKNFRTLIQHGLGDHIVPSLASEIVARNYGGAAFASNPNKILGIGEMTKDSTVCITEMLFQEPYERLPRINVVDQTDGSQVHWCTRLSQPLVHQLVEFINSGTFIDICSEDQCIQPKCTF